MGKMAQLSFGQINESLNKADLSALPPLRISILRNVMLEPIEAYLRYFAYQHGFSAQVRFGEYDNIFQEAVGVDDLLDEDVDCILIFSFLENLSWDFARNFASLDENAILREIERIQQYFDGVIRGIRRQTNGMILWHAVEIPSHPLMGILDSQVNDGQIAVIQKINNSLRKKLLETPNAYYVDVNLCIIRIGARKFYDHRYWHIGRAPYSGEGLCEIALEDVKFIRALKGKNKKCLVLDCDDTLWRGIVGEDGLAGIKLDKTYPGSAYYEFQLEVLNLYNQGIIIALCSKNNEGDVWEVFRKHPDMVLREKHIAAAQINWRDKATNIRQIASDLSIGLDSIVFLDDSEFEINLIKKELPEVEAILLPKDKPVEYRRILASCGLFDALHLSEEDKKRGRMYRAEANRKKMRSEATDLESYYHSLQMIVEICPATDFEIPRIAQLTQKTNQFNLTTRRYSEADIAAFSNSLDCDVLYVKLNDNHGDLGIIGSCILKCDGDTVFLDTFLLSCRALGRGVEDVLLHEALKGAKQRGCKTVVGEYYATARNSQVEPFLPKNHFREVDAKESNADRLFHFDLIAEIKESSNYFHEIRSVFE